MVNNTISIWNIKQHTAIYDNDIAKVCPNRVNIPNNIDKLRINCKFIKLRKLYGLQFHFNFPKLCIIVLKIRFN